MIQQLNTIISLHNVTAQCLKFISMQISVVAVMVQQLNYQWGLSRQQTVVQASLRHQWLAVTALMAFHRSARAQVLPE